MFNQEGSIKAKPAFLLQIPVKGIVVTTALTVAEMALNGQGGKTPNQTSILPITHSGSVVEL